MDPSLKDGTIRHVMRAFNPRGCRVTAFGVPTPLALAHDHLWRIHAVTLPRGEIAIFDRSPYESLLVVRVQELVPR
jgi:polyphosphate kinase 2 (PPK2 family)